MRLNYGYIATAMLACVVTCIVTVHSLRNNDTSCLTTYDKKSVKFIFNAAKDILK